MTQSKKVRHDNLRFFAEQPWLLTLPYTANPLIKLVIDLVALILPLSRMQTEYRGKDAVLDPTGYQFITSSALHVAAYVMAPPSVADV
jgi:hypothetical protein